MATGEPRRHADEDLVLKFLQRPDQSSAYVRRCADWIKAEYPGSAPTLLPKLRVIYRDKKRQGL